MILELYKDGWVFGSHLELIGKLEEHATRLKPVPGGRVCCFDEGRFCGGREFNRVRVCVVPCRNLHHFKKKQAKEYDALETQRPRRHSCIEINIEKNRERGRDLPHDQEW